MMAWGDRNGDFVTGRHWEGAGNHWEGTGMGPGGALGYFGCVLGVVLGLFFGGYLSDKVEVPRCVFGRYFGAGFGDILGYFRSGLGCVFGDILGFTLRTRSRLPPHEEGAISTRSISPCSWSRTSLALRRDRACTKCS